jgi:transcriptional regulator with XRE-family HTH domain
MECVMTMTQESGVGDKVRLARKLAGWSQEKLAREANFSASLVRKVERGRAPASPAFVAACARALRVNPADLLEQPYPRQTRDEQQVHAGVAGIRRELAAYKIEPDGTMDARPERELAADVAKASKLRHSVNLGDLGTLLPARPEPSASASSVFSPKRSPRPDSSCTSSATSTFPRCASSGTNGQPRKPTTNWPCSRVIISARAS